MRKLGIVVAAIACLSLLSVAPTMAMNWSLGANLGYEMLMPTYENAKSVNMIGWPMGGLRLGFVGENPTHELYLLSAVSMISSDGASQSTYGITGNYQFNVASKGPVTPYLTVGAGIEGVSYDDGDYNEGAMSVLFGGGVGISKKVGQQGTMRAEVRFERNMEGKEDESVVIGEANHVIVRLGFDLWGK